MHGLTKLEKVLITLLVLLCLGTIWTVGAMQSKLCYAYLEPIVAEYCGLGNPVGVYDSLFNCTEGEMCTRPFGSAR